MGVRWGEVGEMWGAVGVTWGEETDVSIRICTYICKIMQCANT